MSIVNAESGAYQDCISLQDPRAKGCVYLYYFYLTFAQKHNFLVRLRAIEKPYNKQM